MVDFRTKVITLASMAMMFAGMAHGQATLGAVTVTQAFVRAEGQAELLPSTTVALATSEASTINLIVVLTPSVAITSQSSSSHGSETTATPYNGAVAGTAVNGVVVGNQVTFTGIATSAAGATTSVVISNIRVNAASILVPLTPIQETISLTGPGAASLVSSTAATTVAFTNNGLAASTVTGAISNTICAGAANNTVQYTVNVTENFAGAFKVQGAAGSGAGESGTNANFQATNGTRIAVTLGNIPANVLVYAPLSVSATGIGVGGVTGIFTMIFSPTAPTAGSNYVGAAGTSAPLTTYGQVAIANNTGTIYYEETTASALPATGVTETFAIPVYYVATAGGVTAAASAATVAVSFAPTGSTTNYPNFVVGTSTSTLTKGSSFTLCNTTILFPYLTNSSGFESGIAIANTSIDNLGLHNGAPNGSNSVAAQSGTCTLSFYGSATAASNPASFTTPIVTAGTTGTPFTLTSVAGAGFTGYMLANCNFQYAHGFTYIVSQFGANNGVAMGYVAYVLPQPRSTSLVNGIEALGN